MDLKSKVLVTCMLLILVGAIGYAYYNYIIKKNFEVIEVETEE